MSILLKRECVEWCDGRIANGTISYQMTRSGHLSQRNDRKISTSTRISTLDFRFLLTINVRPTSDSNSLFFADAEMNPSSAELKSLSVERFEWKQFQCFDKRLNRFCHIWQIFANDFSFKFSAFDRWITHRHNRSTEEFAFGFDFRISNEIIVCARVSIILELASFAPFSSCETNNWRLIEEFVGCIAHTNWVRATCLLFQPEMDETFSKCFFARSFFDIRASIPFHRFIILVRCNATQKFKNN